MKKLIGWLKNEIVFMGLMILDLGQRILKGIPQWERWIHLVFLAIAGFLSIQFNDPRFIVAGFSGALAYSLLWFKLATSRG